MHRHLHEACIQTQHTQYMYKQNPDVEHTSIEHAYKQNTGTDAQTEHIHAQR